MRSTHFTLTRGTRAAIVLFFAALVALPALAGCEAGDATSPVPPPADAAPDRATTSDAGADDARSSDGATRDAHDAAPEGDAGTPADGATD